MRSNWPKDPVLIKVRASKSKVDPVIAKHPLMRELDADELLLRLRRSIGPIGASRHPYLEMAAAARCNGTCLAPLKAPVAPAHALAPPPAQFPRLQSARISSCRLRRVGRSARAACRHLCSRADAQ